MIKTSNPGRKTVELRPVAAPSRIRRDPPPPAGKTAKGGKASNADPTERDAWTVVTGVMLFAVALMIIILGASDFLS